MKDNHIYCLYGLDGKSAELHKDTYNIIKCNMIESNINIKEDVSIHVTLDSKASKDYRPTLVRIDTIHKLWVNTIDR